MADRSMIFSAPMARALLDGRKTQTRRMLKPQPQRNVAGLWVWPPRDHLGGDAVAWSRRYGGFCQTDDGGLRDFLLSRPNLTLGYAPGDRLWVKEAWRSASCYDDLPPSAMGGDEPVRYEADASWQTWGWGAPLRVHGRYRHARFMPRWASRLTLIVTDVRVQRVQEISEEDAEAEGAATALYDQPQVIPGMGGHRLDFRDLWNSLHGPDAWSANPWVCALTFTVHRCNIDQMTGAPDA